MADPEGVDRPRSWAVALLVAHVALVGVLVVVSVVLLALGWEDDPLGGRVTAVVVGLLVVVGVTPRFGVRPQTRAGRAATVAGAAVVVPWTWYVLGVAGLSAYTGPLLGVLALFLWPWFLLLVAAAPVVAGVDAVVGAARRRHRGRPLR
ncbi:hypothetical protein SAMN03159343_0597 [Klenkia marina]|uniref:Uncharacterized protein n=1 Tax=Klenkia marina TaxID=1960309 RepID=A0A1G4XDQ8_9ACTN|nr:hypothetical protein [Klenkia marina]SCX39134.1 hypothetical protein SAMN03159343_0597 [Klenkia marina]